MPSQHIIDLCNSAHSVTSILAENPHEEVHKAAGKLFGKEKVKDVVHPGGGHSKKEGGGEEDKWEGTLKCGKFDGRPSELFLKVCMLCIRERMRRADGRMTDL